MKLCKKEKFLASRLQRPGMTLSLKKLLADCFKTLVDGPKTGLSAARAISIAQDDTKRRAGGLQGCVSKWKTWTFGSSALCQSWTWSVVGSRSNRILQFRTGSGSDWISKKLNRIRYGYPNCIDHCSKMLNQSFFSDINRIGSNIWTGLPY